MSAAEDYVIVDYNASWHQQKAHGAGAFASLLFLLLTPKEAEERRGKLSEKQYLYSRAERPDWWEQYVPESRPNVPEVFSQEYNCIPTTDTPSALRQLAERYFNATEEFDRQVCTGEPRHGLAMPANGYERRLINQNAKNWRERIENEARELGFDRKELNRAISHYQRYGK